MPDKHILTTVRNDYYIHSELRGYSPQFYHLEIWHHFWSDALGPKSVHDYVYLFIGPFTGKIDLADAYEFLYECIRRNYTIKLSCSTITGGPHGNGSTLP